MMRDLVLAAALAVALGTVPAAAQPATPPQTQEDDYTRYELLGPDTAQFRIVYEVTATRAGAPFFFNAIRRGSVATDERVFDAATGAELKWEVVNGATARAEGHPLADLDTEWIKVHLARPVPAGGEARVVIDKTYKDAKSYYRKGDLIVFDRALGIRRNAVVLPAGYRLVSCNVPSQVLPTPDGRVMIAFMNPGPAAAPLVITAAPGLAPFTPSLADSPRRLRRRRSAASQRRAAHRARAPGPRGDLPAAGAGHACRRDRTRLHRDACRRRALRRGRGGRRERRAAGRPQPRHRRRRWRWRRSPARSCAPAVSTPAAGWPTTRGSWSAPFPPSPPAGPFDCACRRR